MSVARDTSPMWRVVAESNRADGGCSPAPDRSVNYSNGGRRRDRTYARSLRDCWLATRYIPTLSVFRKMVGHLGFEPRSRWLKANYSAVELVSEMVPHRGFEPRSHGLRVHYSAVELAGQCRPRVLPFLMGERKVTTTLHWLSAEADHPMRGVEPTTSRTFVSP